MDDSNPTTTTPTPTLPPDAAPAAPAAPPSSTPPPSNWSPTTNQRDDGGRIAGIVAGLILLVIGIWFFADKTLGLNLPDIRWSQLWPLILVVIGAAILVGALRRDRR